jgi:heat shock protein HslJ
MCAEDTIEDEYLNALGKVTSFKIDNLGLKLYDKEEQTVLIFKEYTKTDNKVRIHDIWSAVRIGGYPINRMVNVPRLEINTRDMKIYGNDGCNEYFGSILELTDNHMSIGAVGSTRKMCPEMETPQRYIGALSTVESYVFDKDILILRDGEGKEVLAFIKSD